MIGSKSPVDLHPAKFNMEPENNGFQMDFPFPGTYFQVNHVANFGGVFQSGKSCPARWALSVNSDFSWGEIKNSTNFISCFPPKSKKPM